MSTDVVAIVQPDYEESSRALYRDFDSFVATSDDDIAQVLNGGDWSVVAIHGDDSLVSRVLSSWYADRGRRSRGATFAAAPVSDHAHVARSVGASNRLGAFGKAVRAAAGSNGCDVRNLAALYVSDSGLSFRRVAFTVGFGRLSRGGFASVAELVDHSLDTDESDSFRWVVDGQAAPAASFVVASSLGKAWSTLSMGRGPSFRAGDSLAALLPQATRLGRVLSKATGAGQAQAFDRIHIDGASRYLLDGIELHTDSPGVVELRPGPKPKFLSW